MNAGGNEPIAEVVGEEVLDKVREVARSIEQRVWRTMRRHGLSGPRAGGAAAQVAASKGEAMSSQAYPAGNVLVVEDDAATREALALVLEADGCHVVNAANGREGLDRLRQEPPDLILLDLAMPVMDGWQFRREQQQNPDLAPIPVVVLSAAGDLRRRAGSLDAAALLEKPVEFDRLLETCRPLLGGPRPGAPSAGTPDDPGRGGLESIRPRPSAAPLPPAESGPVVLALRSAEEVVPALERLSAAMSAAGYPQRDAFALRLALEEALVNALKHGHRGDPSKEVRLRYRVTAEEAVAEVEDQGPGFDPAAVPDPLAPENLEKPSGRGLLLMRRYLSWLRFNERGNVVTLCRRRSGP